MAEVEPIVQPYGILDDLRRESVAFVEGCWCFHPGIVTQSRLICQYPAEVSRRSTTTDRAVEYPADRGSIHYPGMHAEADDTPGELIQ